MKRNISIFCGLILCVVGVEIAEALVYSVHMFDAASAVSSAPAITAESVGTVQQNPDMSMVVFILNNLLVIVSFIFLAKGFLQFMWRIYRGEIFTRRNQQSLRMFGFGTLGFCLSRIINDANVFAVYRIPYDLLTFGLFVLIVAEAFSLGLKQKEELELTV